ncbi:MAG: hypothetical protein ACO25B_04685 [Chitinophagaceae bacterium]
MKKHRFLIILLFITGSLAAQGPDFPAGWTGHWKGELQWFRAGKTEPVKVNMELDIRPRDSSGHYTWRIVYGSPSEDNRPYLLKPKDTVAGHWVIDEQNGIVLDQYYIGETFLGSFTVNENTILSSMRKEGDRLYVEFISTGARSPGVTGLDTEESPRVLTYRVGSYQKAVLYRIK